MGIACRVRKFACSVTEHCRLESELHALLTRKEGIPVCSASFPLPRLRLALDSNMKEVHIPTLRKVLKL